MILFTESLTRGPGTAYAYDYMITVYDVYMILFTEPLTGGPGMLYVRNDLMM